MTALAECPSAPGGPPVETAVVPLDSIRVRSQVRRTFGSLAALAASIREHGLIENLVVSRGEDDGYELIAGERRYRAAQIAGVTEVPVTIRPQPDPKGRLHLQVAENAHRLDLSLDENLDAVQSMLYLGATDDELASAWGDPVDQMATLRTLMSYGPKLRRLLTAGEHTMKELAPLAQLAPLGKAVVTEALKHVRDGYDVQYVVSTAKADHARAQLIAAATERASKRGLRIVEAPQYGIHHSASTVLALGARYPLIQLDPKAHRKLPCHAVVINPHARSVSAALVAVCTDPATHMSDADFPSRVPGVVHTARHDRTPAEKAAATRKHRTAWRATHAGRTRAIRDLLPELPLDDAMARVAWQILEQGRNANVWRLAARMLFGADTVPEQDQDTPRDQRVDPERMVLTHAGTSGETAVRAAMAVLTARAEAAFTKPLGDYNERRNVVDHFRFLATHGYELADAERDHLRLEYGTDDVMAVDELDIAGYAVGGDAGESCADDAEAAEQA